MSIHLIASGTKCFFDLLKREDTYPSVIMESTSEILSCLKVLGCIQRGEKLSSRNMVLQQDGWMTRINRTIINPDNRVHTLKTVRDIITRSFEILTHTIGSSKESDVITCRMIISDLIKSESGIINLKSTYGDDTKFGCDIEILIQQIEARLAEIKINHKHLFEPPVSPSPPDQDSE